MPTMRPWNSVGLALEVGDGVHVVDVVRHDEGVLALLPARHHLELVLEAVPVHLVGGGQPRVQVEVDLAVGDAGEGARDVELLHVHRVALGLEDLLPQVAACDVLVPSGDDRDADVLVARAPAAATPPPTAAERAYSAATGGEGHEDQARSPASSDGPPLRGERIIFSDSLFMRRFMSSPERPGRRAGRWWRVRWPARGAWAAAARGGEGIGEPVEVDREEHDREAAFEACADVQGADAAHDDAPRPPAPTRPAMTTQDSAIMMVWLTPAMIEGMASGSCTSRSI